MLSMTPCLKCGKFYRKNQNDKYQRGWPRIANPFDILVRPARLGRATYGFEGRSFELSNFLKLNYVFVFITIVNFTFFVIFR